MQEKDLSSETTVFLFFQLGYLAQLLPKGNSFLRYICEAEFT